MAVIVSHGTALHNTGDDVPVGSVWDTGAGNHWQVVRLLDNDRIVVTCVYPRVDGITHVWHVSGVTHGVRLS